MDRHQFHLSIPALDLDATERWYVGGLGCQAGRRSAHALVLGLGGHQLVAQKVEESGLGPAQVGIYPRHFGLVFAERQPWQALLERAQAAALPFGQPPRCRFPGQPLEHHTFFLIDPARNWLEFKHYRDPEAVLGWSQLKEVGDPRGGAA